MCGEIFERENKKQIYCSDKCRQQAIKITHQKCIEKAKEKKKRANDHLDKTLRELDQYNAKNGTYMSYGQYQMMKMLNKSKVKRRKR